MGTLNLYLPTGDRFVYQQRTETRLVFRDPEVVKEVLSLKPDSIMRSELEKYVTELIVGKGLLSEVGETWVTARRTLNPFFHQEALKVIIIYYMMKLCKSTFHIIELELNL